MPKEPLSKFVSFTDAMWREPYRLFFPLGVLMGAVGIGHWLFYALHWIPSYSGFFHASFQMLVYMNCFILGFLLTSIPRFTATPPATRGEVLLFLFLLLGIAGFLGSPYPLVAEGGFVLWLVLLVIFVLKRLKRKRSNSGEATSSSPPTEMVWIPVGIMHGLTGTILLMLGQLHLLPAWSLQVGKPMMEQGFLVAVVIGVGGFLMPRLMGTYYTPKQDPRLSGASDERRPRTVEALRFHGVCGFLLFISFWLEGLGWPGWGYGLRALVISGEFLRSRTLPRFPKSPELYVKLIWVSAWMTALGFWMAAFFGEYRIVMLHLVFIGGFSLMTFAVATMVIMTHSGEAERLRRPLWIFWVALLGLALAVLKRAMVVIVPEKYFSLLGISAAIWMTVGFSWLVVMLPSLLKVPPGDEFERMHEAAKQRLKERA